MGARPEGRHARGPVFDAFAVFWVVFWLVVGTVTGLQVWSLSGITTAAESSATAADQAGRALQQLSELPLIGEGPADLGDEVRAAAADVTRQAGETREDVRRLSILLGLAVAVIPSASLLVLYLPERLRARRQARQVRRLLAAGDHRDVVESYLAHQALVNIPFDRLLRWSSNPVADMAAGRYADLAAAELDRLGLRLTRRP